MNLYDYCFEACHFTPREPLELLNHINRETAYEVVECLIKEPFSFYLTTFATNLWDGEVQKKKRIFKRVHKQRY